MSDLYKLDENHTSIPCDLHEWGQFRKDRNKSRVGDDDVEGKRVSTVFLGVNHNLFDGRPHLFETMVFNDEGQDIYMRRYSTWDESVKGHEETIQWVKDGCKDND